MEPSRSGRIRVACVQIPSMSTDFPENREVIQARIRTAAEQGALLVLLPELCPIPYIQNTIKDYRSLAEDQEGPTIKGWTSLASSLGIHIVGGFLEREENRLFNTAALIGPGGPIGFYRKNHLWEHEHVFFTPGDLGFPVWETPIGRVGILICFDIRFPECSRILALKGADLICIPTGWSTAVNKNQIDALGYTQGNYQAIAQANSSHVAILCANRAGQEGPHEYVGRSLIVDANGRVVAGPASASSPEILLGELTPGESRKKAYGSRSDLFKDRRTDLYDLLLGHRETKHQAE